MAIKLVAGLALAMKLVAGLAMKLVAGLAMAGGARYLRRPIRRPQPVSWTTILTQGRTVFAG
jgi:hypothetical protein